jgi:DNA-binding transcriptional regulator YbjK
MIMSRDINTIPTDTKAYSKLYNPYVEWSDNPKLVELEHDMDNHLENTFNDWLRDIEDEEDLKC